MKRITIAKIFTISAITVLALGVTPMANAQNKGCCNATLKGTFAEKDAGFFTNPAPAAASLFRRSHSGYLRRKGHNYSYWNRKHRRQRNSTNGNRDLYGEPRLHRNLRSSSFAWRLHRSCLFRHG